jgi:hypothetical protein
LRTNQSLLALMELTRKTRNLGAALFAIGFAVSLISSLYLYTPGIGIGVWVASCGAITISLSSLGTFLEHTSQAIIEGINEGGSLDVVSRELASSAKRGSVSQAERVSRVPDMSSGATVSCPFCAESIRADAVVCRYCRSDVAEPIKMKKAEQELERQKLVAEQEVEKQKLAKARSTAEQAWKDQLKNLPEDSTTSRPKFN